MKKLSVKTATGLLLVSSIAAAGAYVVVANANKVSDAYSNEVNNDGTNFAENAIVEEVVTPVVEDTEAIVMKKLKKPKLK